MKKEEFEELLHAQTPFSPSEVDYIVKNIDKTVFEHAKNIIRANYYDCYEFGEEQVKQMTNVPDFLDAYINYAQFGNDYAESSTYITPEGGEIYIVDEANNRVFFMQYE